MTQRSILFAALAVFCAYLPLAAQADIGKIGSPVVPSNAPAKGKEAADKTDAAAQEAKDATAERTPLLVIRFNQRHVYFQRALKQAVESAERAKPGAFYDVVSVVPGGGSASQNQRINEDSVANLNAVVQELQSLGVQAERIHTSSQPGVGVTSQEIQLFVN